MLNPSTRFAATERLSPLRVLTAILIITFVVESAIMLMLRAVAPAMNEGLLSSLLDSVLLVVLLCPALWWLLVRPMRALVEERGELLARTLTIQEQVSARLARDLHDELGQVQTAILLGLGTAREQTLEEARDRVGAIHEMAVEAIESTRRMARGLSPSVLMDFGLKQAVERVCDDLAAMTSLRIDRNLSIGTSRFAGEVEIAMYRVLQEAVTNAAKHAQATCVDVSLGFEDGRLVMSVSDDGKGLAGGDEGSGAMPDAGMGRGLGLVGMRERMVLLGGEFRITTRKDGGTTLWAVVPAAPVTA